MTFTGVVQDSVSSLFAKSAKRMGTERRPYRTPVPFYYRSFPALKRWANNHCANGAGFVEAVPVRRGSVESLLGH